MVCRKCGSCLTEDSVFCSQCGEKVGQSAPVGMFVPAGDLAGFWEDVPKEQVASQNDAQAVGGRDASVGVEPAGSTMHQSTKAEQLRNMPYIPAIEEQPCMIPEGLQEEAWQTAQPVQTHIRPRCGADMPDDGTSCLRCDAVTDVQQEKQMDPKQNDRPSPKWVRWLVIGAVAICVLAGAAFFWCQGRPKTEDEILADIEEQAYILVEDQRMELDVTSFEIEKRKTSDDQDEVYCKVRMEGEMIGITAYRLLKYSKYNGNEWILEEASLYQEETVEVIKEHETLYDMAVLNVEGRNELYSGFENHIESYTVSCDEDKIFYNYEFSKERGVADTSGNIEVRCALYGDLETGYYWVTSVDDSSVVTSWDVDKTWKGHQTNFGTGWHELTIQVDSLTSETVDCQWHYYNRDSWDKEHYYGDGSDCWVISSDAEKIEIGVHYGTALLSYLRVYFYVDGSVEAEFPFVGMADMEVTNETVQQEENNDSNGGPAPEKKEYTVTVLDDQGAPIAGLVVNFYGDDVITPAITDDNGTVVIAAHEEQHKVVLPVIPDGYEHSGNSQEYAIESDKRELQIVLKKTTLQEPWVDDPYWLIPDSGVFSYIGEDISSAENELGLEYVVDIYEGRLRYIYRDQGIMFICGGYGETEILAVEVFGDQVYGYGLSGQMTWYEIAEAIGSLMVLELDAPSKSYDTVNECYKYELEFVSLDVQFIYEWSEDPYSSKSDSLYVCKNPYY